MPCRDDYGSTDYAQEALDKAVASWLLEQASRETKRVQKRADLAARVACELGKRLSAQEFKSLTPESQKWIEEHRARDAKEAAEKERMERLERERQAKRKKDEEFKTSALGKLTHEERRALGLPDPA